MKKGLLESPPLCCFSVCGMCEGEVVWSFLFSIWVRSKCLWGDYIEWIDWQLCFGTENILVEAAGLVIKPNSWSPVWCKASSRTCSTAEHLIAKQILFFVPQSGCTFTVCRIFYLSSPSSNFNICVYFSRQAWKQDKENSEMAMLLLSGNKHNSWQMVLTDCDFFVDVVKPHERWKSPWSKSLSFN